MSTKNNDQLHQNNDHIKESLQCDYEEKQNLYDVQPVSIQRYLESQASTIADLLLSDQSQIRFSLPDRVCINSSNSDAESLKIIPPSKREQSVGGVLDKWVGADLRTNLRIKLTELEDANNPAISVAAGLLRHMIAYHLVHNILPSGRSVIYKTLEGEEIPTEPSEQNSQTSAITQDSDAIVEESQIDEKRGTLQSPFTPTALRFFLPQWVAFEANGKLIVRNTAEAENYLASMQKYLSILHMAVGLSPCFVSDDTYIQKRNGVLGQLVNQGRLLALHQTQAIITEINQRAKSNSLNRGLSLSLPYFDDQDLAIRIHRFEVIPSGRIMFVPAFVVRAARDEQAKVIQDTRRSPSTRKYLVEELKMLETAFLSVKE
jgi:hypothetical protein